MQDISRATVTIFYYCENSLEMQYQICQLATIKSGRVKIPESFKTGKSIVAVCDGAVNVLNVVGDRTAQKPFITAVS